MTRKATDQEIVELVESGVPVVILANMLETSRGHIYNCIKRNKDPAAYKAQTMKHNETRELKATMERNRYDGQNKV